MDKLLERLANSGARITMADPRVTTAQNWLLGLIGTVAILALSWAASSINRLNETMARLVEQNTYTQRINDAQDRRIDSVEQRQYAIEHKP
jgi:hypothetical protein